MQTARLPRLDLRRLIILLAMLSGLITLGIGFYASYKVQRDSLIDSTLAANRAYAAKLADGTELFFHSAQQQLAVSAENIAAQFPDNDVLHEEARRLRRQTDSFNAIVIASAQGEVLATAPNTGLLVGQKLNSPGALRALAKREPLISSPYTSALGTLVILISHPVVAGDGTYLGYIGGVISLRERNILHSMLGEHFYQDGSYLYAVDQSRRLLYHPQPKRLGTVVAENEVIDRVLQGESGSLRVINSQGVDMLAGYAASPAAGWGIVAQRPTADTLQPLDDLMLKVIRQTAPLALLTLLCIWGLAALITRPLSQLAQRASEMDAPNSAERIQRIRSWYFEAAQLKRAMQLGISLLHQRIGKLNLDAQTDPLTGLHNRRGLTLALEMLASEGGSFAVIALDIDHFKRINDSHGHDVGDTVIRQMAGLMTTCSRDADVLCRSGGEEFLMLLPNTTVDSALRVAERLRTSVELQQIPVVGHITVSLGIAVWPMHASDIERVLKLADAALYRAKKNGRNRSEIAEPDQYSAEDPKPDA
ncbi:sensor domain-containing diguanylate cyclase [Stutzerimonas stutzeri]|uniref:sensor domain-containing diguanylate cyclase n=1 Tax=Stutzerimonas stutzeri TaxID=316 RepID=UPI00210906B0|nr:sensor domain-containing diguanylate cyclase [Stutzerimonas stutzeri]MCQ4323072.1 sensor domain-containing diguanylate cyclase [Stutzerimonas stutzeri]